MKVISELVDNAELKIDQFCNAQNDKDNHILVFVGFLGHSVIESCHPIQQT